MKFILTELPGAYIIDVEKREDERGFFARTFCTDEFASHGLVAVFKQGNMSLSNIKYTLRGMHYQTDGAEEVKVIRCTRGAILDVIIDIRPGSPTYCKHIQVELTADNYRQLYVPQGFAHGFISLVPHCEVSYLVSEVYTPGKERGIRWNDPHFGISWPTNEPVLSAKDATHPDFAI
ncbi:MAG: dTDP-4-dehydrorhamnose 3,5-epimerase [Cytophagales bacterium]|nr:dTDP-4-dehydrorhamnose 3,5-epimerase [Cytophagales bacterium]